MEFRSLTCAVAFVGLAGLTWAGTALAQGAAVPAPPEGPYASGELPPVHTTEPGGGFPPLDYDPRRASVPRPAWTKPRAPSMQRVIPAWRPVVPQPRTSREPTPQRGEQARTATPAARPWPGLVPYRMPSGTLPATRPSAWPVPRPVTPPAPAVTRPQATAPAQIPSPAAPAGGAIKPARPPESAPKEAPTYAPLPEGEGSVWRPRGEDRERAPYRPFRHGASSWGGAEYGASSATDSR